MIKILQRIKAEERNKILIRCIMHYWLENCKFPIFLCNKTLLKILESFLFNIFLSMSCLDEKPIKFDKLLAEILLEMNSFLKIKNLFHTYNIMVYRDVKMRLLGSNWVMPMNILQNLMDGKTEIMPRSNLAWMLVTEWISINTPEVGASDEMQPYKNSLIDSDYKTF